MNKRIETDYQLIATEIRREILKMHSGARTSHIGSSLSCVDILVALYFGVLNIDPGKPKDAGRDRFILSKGHAVSSLYAILAKRGFSRPEDLERYCSDGSTMPGHATLGSVPGIEVSTGSLGHGLSIGAGMALAGKMEKRGYKVYVLLSDGECNEGSVWETALFAKQHSLDNLVAIVDYNKMQALGNTDDILSLEPFADKWKMFGWNAKEANGHDIGALIECMKRITPNGNKPTVIIAHTVKGKGVSFMENKLLWHYKSPSEDEVETALKELER
jgi:transketolase